MKGGVEVWFELEDLNTNQTAGDWADQAGMYAYDSTGAHNGAAFSGIVSAFEAALATAPTRTAPTCSIGAPADDPTFAAPLSGTATTFVITATDTVDATSSLLVNLYRDNGTTLMPTDVGGTGSNGGNCHYNPTFNTFYYVLDTTTLADLNYVFAARATNSAGQVTLSNQPNGIREQIHNVTGGVPTINASGGGAAVTNDATGLSSGVPAGGDHITIVGTGFNPGGVPASAVTIGGTNVTSYVVVTDQKITAVTPAKTANTYNTKVTNGAGISAVTTADKFTFTSTTAGPVITSVSPNTGVVGGGIGVLIGATAGGFTGATAVHFGTLAATAFTVNDDFTISADYPAQAAGPVDVTVTTPAGTSGIVTADVFTYGAASTMTATVVAVTTFEGVTYNAPNIPGQQAPMGNGTGTLTLDKVANLAIQVTGGTASQVDVWEGPDDPYGPNQLGTCTSYLGLWVYALNTTTLTNHTTHRLMFVPS